MLLVPLALSAPGGDRSTGGEVVLAAGASNGPWAGVGHGLDGQIARDVALEVAPADRAASAGEVAAGPRRATTSHARLADATAATGTASAKGKAKAKAKAKTAATTTRPAPALEAAAAVRAPAGGSATAAKVADTPPPPPTTAPATTAPPPPPPAPKPAAGDASWDRLAVCESSNTNDAGAPYYGYWQFSAATWHSVGEPGLPSDHPRERQLAAAKRLQAAQGWAPWPDCSRRLGLR